MLASMTNELQSQYENMQTVKMILAHLQEFMVTRVKLHALKCQKIHRDNNGASIVGEQAVKSSTQEVFHAFNPRQSL